MELEDKQRIREIHEFLLGDLNKQGFVGKTVARLTALESRMKVQTKVLVGIAIPALAVVGEKIAGLILK